MRNQRKEILDLLQSRKNEWVTLPEILKLGIAQYNARVYELRHEGYKIENKTIEVTKGERHTAFRLVVEEKPQRQAFESPSGQLAFIG